jgi:uncharacterized protein (TIGR02996 family)
MREMMASAEGRALLAEVAEHPDDDLRRLVVADWLEDHIETFPPASRESLAARAEFIRLEIESARSHSAWRWDERAAREKLDRRSQELKDRHSVAWTGGPFSVPVSFGFSRGFVETVSLSPDDYPSVAARLGTIEPTASLQFDHPAGHEQDRPLPMGWLSAALRTPDLCHATALNFDFQPVTVRHIERLLSSPHCRVATLLISSAALLTPRTLSVIAEAPGAVYLRTLDMSYCERMWVEHARRHDHLLAFTRSENLAGLVRLRVNNLGLSAHTLRQLANGPWRLCELSAEGNKLGGSGAEAVAASPNTRELRTLNLAESHLGDFGAEVLARSPNLPRLAVLDLRGNNITDRGATALAESPHLESIQSIRLARNGISPRACATLYARFGDGLSDEV